MESDNSKLSQYDRIIKILEFVCNNRRIHHITTPTIRSTLFPELELNEIENLFGEIKSKKIPELDYFIEGNRHYLTHRQGLEEFIIKFKQTIRRKKLHRIVEFLSTEYSIAKQSFDSGEIAKAFNPELSIHEVNILCKTIINNGDLSVCPTKDVLAKGMVEVLVINTTHDAYHTNKYLYEEDEQFNIPLRQNIVTGDNVIIGNISGTVTQEDHSNKLTKDKGKPKWLEWLKWIIGILILAAGLIASIISILRGL